MIKKLIKLYRKKFWSCEKYAKFIGVQIGENCLISTKNFSSEAYLIKIGNGCRIAQGVSFFTHGGIWAQRQKLNEDIDFFGKITIGDYTYIGQDAKLMPGVTIGSDVIVGAGAIITKSIEDGCIVAGNPGRIVGRTEDFVEGLRKHSVGSKGLTYEEKRSLLLSLDEKYFLKK